MQIFTDGLLDFPGSRSVIIILFHGFQAHFLNVKIIETEGVVSVLSIVVTIFRGFIISITQLCDVQLMVSQIGNILIFMGTFC